MPDAEEPQDWPDVQGAPPLGPDPDDEEPRHVILLVDDEPEILTSMAHYLEVALPAVRCMRAENGQAALDIIRDREVDLIVTDQRMPVMDGITFLEHAMRLAPQTPKIMLTAYPDLDLAMEAVNEAGVVHFFVKPADPIRLAQAVERVLETHDQEKGLFDSLTRSLENLRRPPEPAPPSHDVAGDGDALA